MSDFAFNNYCIACDKLCLHNSIYCSDECKAIDEKQSMTILDSCTDGSEELVSPMLTPSLYQHYYPESSANNGDITSPLVLGSQHSNSDLDYNQFDLNYIVNSKADATTANAVDVSKQNILSEHMPSTSHNYRKWLTACL